ncbi:S-adenosylmethionine:tRNA ribosyltransferase-isomerase, partial [Bacillus thuringiensis]
MNIQEFDYDLPESLIAQTPLKYRDHSRLLVMDRETGAKVEMLMLTQIE